MPTSVRRIILYKVPGFIIFLSKLNINILTYLPHENHFKYILRISRKFFLDFIELATHPGAIAQTRSI